MPPIPGKPLVLYLTTTKKAIECILGQHDESERKEIMMYYLIKKFTDCKSRYTMVEKLCCALVWLQIDFDSTCYITLYRWFQN
jgi:hypothetical protein